MHCLCLILEPANLWETSLQLLGFSVFQIPLLLQHLNKYQPERLQPAPVKAVGLSMCSGGWVKQMNANKDPAFLGVRLLPSTTFPFLCHYNICLCMDECLRGAPARLFSCSGSWFKHSVILQSISITSSKIMTVAGHCLHVIISTGKGGKHPGVPQSLI